MMKPEWVGFSLPELAQAQAAETSRGAELIAAQLNEQVQSINTPHTGQLLQSLVAIASQSGNFDEFKKNAGTHPYSEDVIANLYRDVVEGKVATLQESGKDAVFSDATINESTSAQVVNAAGAAVARLPVIGGNLTNLGLEGVKALQKAGLTQDDYANYQSVKAKQAAYEDSVQALQDPLNARPETQAMLQERIKQNSPASYTEGEKSLFKEEKSTASTDPIAVAEGLAIETTKSKISQLEDITAVTRGQESIRDLSKFMDKYVNTSAVDMMSQVTKGNFDAADGFIETASVYMDAVIDNPLAVFHTTVQSLPEIAMSLTGPGFAASLGSNFSEKTLEARDHYKTTFGTDALGNADNQLLATTALAAFVDTGADRIIGKGGFKVTEKLAEKGILQGTGVLATGARGAIGSTQAVGTGFVTEGFAEGGGEALTQAAGKQGYADIEYSQSFVEGVLGSGSGAGIAGVSSVLKGTKEVTSDTAKKMVARKEAAESGDISSLVSNPLTMDVAGGMAVMSKIMNDESVSPEQKHKAVSDMEAAYDMKPMFENMRVILLAKKANTGSLTADEQRKLDTIESKITELNKYSEPLKQAKDIRDGISIEKSIDTLTAPTVNEDGTQPNPEISRMAINKVIQETMDAQSLFSAEDAQAILTARGEDGTGELTGEQSASLRAHIATQHALKDAETLSQSENKTIKSVREDIYNGSKTQFGAKQYVAGILASLKHGDTKSAEYLFNGLYEFTKGHEKKAYALAAINESYKPKPDGKITPFTPEEQIAMITAASPEMKFTGFSSGYVANQMATTVGQEATTLLTVLEAMSTRMELHNQSKTEPASVPVATVAESQTEATVATQPQAEPTQTETTNRASEITAGGNLTQPVSGTDTTLDELLSLSEDEAIARINPSGVNTNTEDEVKLTDETAPDYEQDSTQITEVDGVRIVETKSGDIHAVDKDNNVVSSIGLQDGVTVVQNRDDAPRGIGTQVIKEFIRRNPNAKAGSFTQGGEKAYRRAIRELQVEKETQPSKQISPEFTVSKSKGYAERTKENAASADVTIAIAADFTTAGERLTAKAAGNKLFKATFGQLPETVAKNIVTFLNKKGAKTLNIAGNGIYTFVQKDPTVTQEAVDEYMYQVLKQVVESPDLKNKITNVRSGGQTGMDEAGVKAAMRLGIPTIVHTTPSWAMRDVNGKDSFNETEFKARFNLNNAEATQPSKREGVSPERETEVVTGTVTDEVLNEGVATEQAEGGTETTVYSPDDVLNELLEQRDEVVQDVSSEIINSGVNTEARLNAVSQLANLENVPVSDTEFKALGRLVGKDNAVTLSKLAGQIISAKAALNKVAPLLQSLQNIEGYPNVVAKYLQVKPSKKKTPLVAMKDFMGKLRTDLNSTVESIIGRSPEGEESLLVNKLLSFSTDFKKSLLSSVVFNPQYATQNPISYFVDTTGNLKSEVVDALSVVSFNWLAENAIDTLVKTDDQIGAVLGLELEDRKIHSYVYQTVGQAGVPFNEEVVNIGNEVIKTLGLQVNKETGGELHHTFMHELAISMGITAVTAMRAMQDTQGKSIVNEVILTAEQRNVSYLIMSEGLSLEQATEAVQNTPRDQLQFKEDLRTIKVDFITDTKSGVNKLSDHIQGEIIGPVQAAGSFLQELFGTLKATKMPTFKPVKVGDSDVLMKRTDQILPQKSIDLQNKQNSTPNYFKKGFARLFGALPLTEIAEWFDFDSDVELTKHVDNVESAKSVNNLIMLELGRVYDFHMQYTAHRDFESKGYDLPFYLSYENNRVFRVQTQQNVMNAQSNKLTRHVMYKGDWNQSYNTNPSVNPQAALAWDLAVAQAFGISIDKQYPEVSQKQLQELRNDADIAAGIEAASWINDANAEITTTQWTDIKNAVAKLGKTTAAMDGLLALGAKLNAERNGDLSFQSDIGIEFDGVTNGPMLVLMQYANFDSTWAAQAEAGGIYVNSEFTDTVTAKLRGVLDRYQQAAVNAASKWERTDAVSYKSAGQKVTLLLNKVKPALDSIYGLLAKRDTEGNYTIPPSARNLMKGIVTPLGYQSSAQAAQRDFGNSIVDKITSLYEKLHSAKEGNINPDSAEYMNLGIQRTALFNALNSLAPGFIEEVNDPFDGIQYLKTKINVNSVYKFDSTDGKVSMTLPEYLGRTYGSVLTDAVTELSQSSESMRADVVQVTNLAVAIYEITRQQLIDKVIAAKGTVKGKAKLLTTDEMNAIDEKLKAIHPEMAIAISSELGKGISILKTKGTTAQQVEVKVEFAKAIPTKDVFGNSLTSHKTSTVISTPEVVEVPGVSAVPNQTLATDASILTLGSLASTDQEVLHDASINSPVTAVENMRKWNDAFYRVALNHSIPVNTAAMANRIFDGASKLIPSIDFTYAMAEKYKLTALFEGQDKSKPLSASVISSLFQAFTNAANLSFTQKKEFFAKNVITINHYAAPDAEVTYHNGVKIDLDSMTTEQVEKEFNVQFKRINQVVKSAPQGSDDVDVDNKAATPNTTNISTPSTGGEIAIHAPLVKEFERKNNVLTLEQALSTIDAKTSGATMAAVKSIITKMLKQSSNDLKVVMYNEANTYTGDLAWISSSTKVKELAADSRGLYIPAGVEGNTSPYILLMEGTDATNSGVTQETLMHEVLHHIFDGHLSDANSVATKEITKLMESVRKQLTTYKDPKVLSWIAANSDSSGNLFGLTSPKEFLAWGLSNQQFQNLLKATSLNEAEANQLRTNAGIKSAWKGFVTTIKKVLFGADVKSESLDNTLQGLLEIVGSIGQTNAVTLSGSISRQQVNQGHRHDITKMNSIELFNRMKTMGHTKASTAHSQFLGNVLESVVNAALTPLQVILTSNRIGEAYGELTAADRLEVYTSLTKGTSIQGMPNQIGFNKSVQESYVYGLTQAVLDEGLAATSNHSNAANKLFNIAKQKLTYLDFMEDPTSQDPLEIEFAQRRYDSVFDVGSYATNTYSDTSSGLTFEMHKSNYLRNFLALASTNEQFANALRNVSIPVSTKPVTLLDKIIGLVTDVFNFILNKTTGVNTRDNVKVNLDRLTARLVTKHLEEQSKLEKVLDGTLSYTSAALGYAAKVLRQGIVKIGASNAVQNSQFKAVRTAGTIAKLVGSDRSEFLFKSVDQLFSQLSKGKQSILGEIGNELKGTTKDTTKVHTLLRIANHVLDRGRKQVIETTKKMLLSSFHRELSKQEKVGLTKFLLRTDAISLNALGYTQDQLANLIDRPTYRAQEIANLEGKISGFVTDAKLLNYYLNMAEELGTTMVNGFSSDANMVPNAYAIANVWKMQTVQRPDDATVAAVMPLIDGLASIHAIQRTAAKAKYSGVANLIREEHTRNDANGDRDNNGITFMLRTHTQLQEKALKENFGGNPALMRKGHMPSITNPYLDVQVGYKADSALAAKRGYTEMYELENDANHHMAPQRAMFLSKAGGLAQFTRMAFSTTQNKTIGFKISDPGDIAILTATAIQQEARLTNGRVSPLYSRNPVHAQATFNEDGDVVGYRYVMAESTKDNLLERDDDFSEVLPKHAGNVYDKSVTKPHNELVVETLKEQYDIDVAAGKAGNYIRLSLKSDDPELVELYKLLPDATREHIKKVFGTDSIPVRAEFLRVVFGFRNVTITDLWTKETDNGFFRDLVKNTFETVTAGNGMLVASHFERALKDIVRVAKTNLVVRTGVITAANFISNTYDLLINGLSLREAASWQADGYKYGIQYIKLTSRIAEINMLLKADHNPSHRKKLESEKAQLMQLQATNPAAKLIEAGLLQTIVLEVNQDIDPFSMTSRWAKRLEEKTSKLPQGVQDVGKFVLMTRDSQSFEVMNRLVQFGDFAARYALYKKITTRKDKPMNHVDAIQKVITHFVNYDLPTHRLIQYGNDMGFIWFSRYWLRIQKVILTNFAENPGRVLTGMMLQGMLGVDIADTHDSSVISTGVLHPFGGFDRVASGLIANPVLLQ